MVRGRVNGSVRASDSFAILLHFLTYSLGWKGAKLQAHQVASVAEWLECLQYDLWSMGSNPTSADFFYFFTFFTVYCLRFILQLLDNVHDI